MTTPAIPDHAELILPAPAKLNLMLHILGRRADGYHLLQTLFQFLDYGDELGFALRQDGEIRLHTEVPGVPHDSNLIVRAARRLQEASATRLGADIWLDKRLPMGGGIGGGSSDAATTLLGLDHLWQTQLGEERLAELGLALGADVPVFVRGRNAWAEGVGERLLPVALPPAWYVLASPGVHAATAELFQAPDLTRDAPPVTIAGFLSGAVLGNAFEPVLRRREPAIEAMFEALARIGAPRLTGSGSGCFVEFADRGSAEAALAALPPGMNAWLARGAERSPLLDAVEQHH